MLHEQCRPQLNHTAVSRHCEAFIYAQGLNILGIPGLPLQILQHHFPARVPLIPPCQPGANDLLVQVPPIRQDDLGNGALIANMQ